MSNIVIKKILKDCDYFAKEVSQKVISPNVLLYVLSLDGEVHAELLLHGADPKLIHYFLNPFRLKTEKVRKTNISREVAYILDEAEDATSSLDIFFEAIKYKYVAEIIMKTGYLKIASDKPILGKYTYAIESNSMVKNHVQKYQKMNKLLNNKNIMIMGALGSGRFEFIKNFAKYNAGDFSVFYFDLFHFLRLDEERLFGIIKALFEELGDNYLYIPNFLQTITWITSLQYNDVYTLLEEECQKGKVITKVNKNHFDSKQYHLSKIFNFFSINAPIISSSELFDLLGLHAKIYEKFYDIEISDEELRNLIKEANFYDSSLAQPGKSLKRLMHLALSKYGNSDTILEQPKKKEKVNELDILLKKRIIGQDTAIDDIMGEMKSIDIFEGGVIKSFLFQGEIGCGKLLTATELSRLLFGEDTLQYIDLKEFNQFPGKMRLYEALDALVDGLYGGIIFIDNIEVLNTDEIDILSYIKHSIQKKNPNDLLPPVMIIASARMPVTTMQHYTYILENFDKIVYFSKLTMRDLEKIAEKQISKIKDLLSDKDLNPFVVSAHANSSLNALGVKKVITSMSS